MKTDIQKYIKMPQNFDITQCMLSHVSHSECDLMQVPRVPEPAVARGRRLRADRGLLAHPRRPPLIRRRLSGTRLEHVVKYLYFIFVDLNEVLQPLQSDPCGRSKPTSL